MKIHIYLFVLFATSPLFAQTNGTIKGKVVDDKTKEVIQNAIVQLLPQELNTVTSTKGVFQFNKVGFGKHTIAVSVVGYVSQIVEIKDGEEIIIALQERIMGLENV